jgi:pimeloyl-ACP methyl ester carboxylesterase
MAPVARELADQFCVLEPFQRASGDEPLTVARHVEDLRQLVASSCGETKPAFVGSSWGAMLALAFAATHPDKAGPLVLIGCGTFDPVARQRLRETTRERMSPFLQQRLEQLTGEYPDPDARLRATAQLLNPIYTFDPIGPDIEVEACDARGHHETWEDMLRLQSSGVYPSAFVAIRSPVLMLHGSYDPHPGAMIRANLQGYLPHLEYREWDRCGHYPWLETAVRDEFFTALREWLARYCGANGEKPA